jgi:RNA polymerase sigma-70 factor (ECF subfamily)
MDHASESQPSDATLIAATLSGKVEAFTELVRSHQKQIRVFLGRYLSTNAAVDDVAQETFLHAYKDLGSYDSKWSFRTWLYGIAKNHACNHLRSESRRLRHQKSLAKAQVCEWVAGQPDFEPAVDPDVHLSALKRCLKKLPSDSARIIQEHYFETKSAAQIAKEHGRSENAVRLLLFRVRQILRQCITIGIAQP